MNYRRMLLILLLGSLFRISPALAQEAGLETGESHLSIRMLDLWTYGDSIRKWIEPGTLNFAQIGWRDNNLSRYDFRPEPKPEPFLQSVERAREQLKAKADKAHQLGLLVYLNEYELNFPEFIQRETLLPAEARERFMEEKVYELFVQCPWLDGYMITPTESKLGAANPEEFQAIAMGAYKGLKRAEKELGEERYLFVRSWLSIASKLREVRQYFPISTDPEIARDIIVVAKPGLGDFVMHRPLNPLFGAIQPHSTVVMFDVSVSEYRSLGWYPQGPAELWGYRMQQLAATPGVVGIQLHTGRLTEVEGFTPETLFPRFKDGLILYPFHGGVKWSPWHHLNIYTIFALLEDPDRPARSIYEAWAKEHYGEEAAEPLADILLLADDALYHGMLTFGVNLNNHSHFIYGGVENPIAGMTRAIEYQLQLQPYLAPLFEINSDVVDRALMEKHHAVELVETMLSILDDNVRHFDPEDYRNLRQDLERMRGAMRAYQFVQGGYFAYQLAIAEPPVPNRAYYVELVREMVEAADQLHRSELNFLHQRGDRSFIHMTRAFRRGLEERGLWKQ